MLQEQYQVLGQAFQLCSIGTNDNVKQGEQLLYQLRDQVSYPKLLMDYFTQNADGLRAAIEFKLWSFKYRHFDDYQVEYYGEYMTYIKQNLVNIYMTSSRSISLQLRPAIVAIASRDFPTKWGDLVKSIIGYLSSHTLLSLKLLRKLTAKYEISARSDPLYEEIIEVCNTVHDPLLQLTTILLQQNLLKELKSALRLFYYLNYQDLHPAFEDNVRSWMEILGTTLKGTDFKCKGEAMKDVFLYTVKYKDDFSELIIQFSNEIWQVCTTTTEDAECDKMVMNALKYFKALMNWPEIKQNLEMNLKNLVQSLIVKNVSLQKLDISNFNDEINQFIETFFENSDIDTRRAQSNELFKTMAKQFPQQLSFIIADYLKQYITIYSQGQTDANAEIIIINLLCDGCVYNYMSRIGAMELILQEELVTTYYNSVLKNHFQQLFTIIQSPNYMEQINPILIAFQFRFIFVFRNYIPKSDLTSLASVVSKFAANLPLSKISCYTVNALLTVKDGDFKDFSNKTMFFTKQNVGGLIDSILQDIYTCTKSQQGLENYSLKCIGTIINLLQEDSYKYVDAFSDLFNCDLSKILKGQEFQSILQVFENIASMADIVQQSSLLQNKILQTLDNVYHDKRYEILAFILQIYSLFLRMENNTLLQYYEGISNDILNPQNWTVSNQELFPGYIVYLQGWFTKKPVPDQNLQAILTQVVQINPHTFCQLSQLVISINGQWSGICLKLILEKYSQTREQNINQKMINKELFLLLGFINIKYGISVLQTECNKISKQCLEQFIINEINVVKSVSIKQNRSIIFQLLNDLLFKRLVSQLDNQTWCIIFQAIMENIYMKRRQAVRFYSLERDNDKEISSSSGFQLLKPLNKYNINQLPLIDEDSEFAKCFKLYYSSNQLPIAELIDSKKQELLTKMIQSV